MYFTYTERLFFIFSVFILFIYTALVQINDPTNLKHESFDRIAHAVDNPPASKQQQQLQQQLQQQQTREEAPKEVSSKQQVSQVTSGRRNSQTQQQQQQQGSTKPTTTKGTVQTTEATAKISTVTVITTRTTKGTTKTTTTNNVTGSSRKPVNTTVVVVNSTKTTTAGMTSSTGSTEEVTRGPLPSTLPPLRINHDPVLSVSEEEEDGNETLMVIVYVISAVILVVILILVGFYVRKLIRDRQKLPEIEIIARQPSAEPDNYGGGPNWEAARNNMNRRRIPLKAYNRDLSSEFNNKGVLKMGTHSKEHKKHLLQDEKSTSIRNDLKFDNNLNEIYLIGTDVEILEPSQPIEAGTPVAKTDPVATTQTSGHRSIPSPYKGSQTQKTQHSETRNIGNHK